MPNPTLINTNSRRDSQTQNASTMQDQTEGFDADQIIIPEGDYLALRDLCGDLLRTTVPYAAKCLLEARIPALERLVARTGKAIDDLRSFKNKDEDFIGDWIKRVMQEDERDYIDYGVFGEKSWASYLILHGNSRLIHHLETRKMHLETKLN